MRIVVTGSTGFVGTAVSEALIARGHKVTGCSRAEGVDLRDPQAAANFLGSTGAEIVVHCAAHVGGIGYVGTHAVEVFEDNLAISTGLLRGMAQGGIRKLVTVMPNCTYPGHKEIYREAEWWDGPVHDSVLMYGLPRKMLWGLCKTYAEAGGLRAAHLIFPNMYGPGDHFDPTKSHALGALIAKIIKARDTGAPEIEIWGTGDPVREWMYVEDAAEAVAAFLDQCECDQTLLDRHDIFNVGIASGISIAEVAAMIQDVVGWDGIFDFNTDRPDGAPKKILDGERFAALTGWSPQTPLKDGIRATVEWYENHRAQDYAHAH